MDTTEQKLQSSTNNSKKPLGFWSCWALTVGIMIGSGVFLLPSTLAPYGMMSFWGWALSAGGSIAIALVIARLSNRTNRSGGVYRYSRDAFGDLVGFLMAWGYWSAYWIGISAMSLAFVGYLAVFLPNLINNPQAEAITALMLIWVLTLINTRGLKEAGSFQLVMTLLKLVPLLLIIAFGFVAGEPANLPATNPSGAPWIAVMATTALLTMWAFSGMEAGALPAGDVENPKRTIPRAIVLGTLMVAFIYIGSTLAVMLLVPAEVFVTSTAPFAEAAKGLGEWGPTLVAIGALISTAGAVNGTIFLLGQVPMSVALDGLTHPILGKRNAGDAPVFSLLLASALGSILLLANFNKGLLEMFKFLALMSTSMFLLPLLVSALAELKYSWKNAKAWAIVAILAVAYSAFAIYGAGLVELAWGVVLYAVGVPLYFWGKNYSLEKNSNAR